MTDGHAKPINVLFALTPSADALELWIEQPVFLVDQTSPMILVRLTIFLNLVACRLPVYRRTTLMGWLSFLITLSAISESRRDRQVATGLEDLYSLEQAFAVFRIVRGRRTVQSP